MPIPSEISNPELLGYFQTNVCNDFFLILKSRIHLSRHLRASYVCQSSIIEDRIEDLTCPRVDRNFIFECSNRYLMSERKHTNDDVFDDFPKIPDTLRRFPKIFQKCSEGKTNEIFLTLIFF